MSDWLDAEAHADRAQEWFERGRWAEAEAELRKAIALNPDQSEWHFHLGLTLEAAGRDSEALSSYEHAIGLLPDQIEPLVAAGIVCNRLDQFERAIERFDRAIRLDRHAEITYGHKMESHFRLGDHDEVETTFFLAQQTLNEPGAHCLAIMAESLMTRGSFRRAEWCLKEALRLDPGMPRLRARLGAVLGATGHSHRAIQMYLRDMRDDPGNVDTLLDFGDLLMDLGRLPDAAEKFRRVLEMEPANIEAHHRLGRIAMVSRRHEQAHLAFELVLKLDAGFPQIRLDVAEALMCLGRVNDARQMLLAEHEQLARAEETARDRRRGAAEKPRSEGRSSEEVRWTERRLGAYFERFGRLLLRAGRATQAAITLERALMMDDRNPAIHRDLALAYFRAGKRTEGVAASRRAYRLDPDCIRPLHNLALAALEDGRLEIAGGWIARGMAIDVHDVGIRRLRMRLYLALLRRRIGRLLGKKRRSDGAT